MNENTTNENASEGTRLGRDQDEFNAAEGTEFVQSNPEDKATKIGNVSDFEKSLYSNEEKEENKKSSNEDLLIQESEKQINKEDEENQEETLSTNQEETNQVENTDNQSTNLSDEINKKPELEQEQTVELNVNKEDQLLETIQSTSNQENSQESLLETKGNDFSDLLEESVKDYKEGDIIKGIVRGIEKTGVLVDLKYKSDGFISNTEFSHDPDETPKKVLNLGDEIDVYIERLESKEGYIILSRKRAQYELAWTELHKFAKINEEVEIRVTSKVGGGLVVDYYGIKGFMPASQVLDNNDEINLETYINTKMKVSVLKADRRRRKVIFSNKSIGSTTSNDMRNKLIDELEVGQTREGKVTSIKDFGVFVDLGGIEGLVHISEISWTRVQHPSDILNVGDSVSVFILGVDKDQLKVSLGMKQLEKDPWVIVKEKYEVGQMISGKISRIVPFGAFIQLENGLEGLIHISELSNEHIKSVEDVVKEGEEITARIIKLNTEEQRIGLSLKDQSSDIEPSKDNNELESDENISNVSENETESQVVEIEDIQNNDNVEESQIEETEFSEEKVEANQE